MKSTLTLLISVLLIHDCLRAAAPFALQAETVDAHPISSTPEVYDSEVFPADFDGDGDTDVAWVPEFDYLRLALNDGAGHFAVSWVVTQHTFPGIASVCDWEGDGDVDLVMTSGVVNTPPVMVLLNDGHASFTPGPQYEFQEYYDNIGRVLAADADDDGDIDLLYSHYADDNDNAVPDGWRLDLCRRTGSGFTMTNGKLAVTQSILLPHFEENGMELYDDARCGLFFRDCDRDGHTDIVAVSIPVSNDNNNLAMNLVRGQPNGTFAAPLRTAPIGYQMMRSLLEDMNGDARPDLVMSSRSQVVRRLISSGGQPGPQSEVDHLTPEEQVDSGAMFRPVVCDVDADGDNDVLCSVRTSSSPEVNRVYAWDNNGFGSFGPRQMLLTLGPEAGSSLAHATHFSADIDRDGDDDLFHSHTGAGLLWTPNRLIHRNAFLTPHTQTWLNAGEPEILLHADLNGDGRDDLIRWSAEQGELRWSLNVVGIFGGVVGQTFTPGDSMLVQAADGVTALAVADIDGDGDCDLARTQGGAQGRVSWLRNDGAGETWTALTIATAGDFRGAALTDFDRDGDIDVIASSHAADEVWWYEQHPNLIGGVAWTPHTLMTGVDGPVRVWAGSISGARKPDIVVQTAQGQIFRYVEVFGLPSKSLIANGTGGLAAGDVNRDGRIDLLTLAGGNLTILPGAAIGFGAPEILAAPGQQFPPIPGGMEIADMDHDGDPEIIVSDSGNVRVLTNAGAARYLMPQPPFPGGGALAVFETEHDGRTDVIAAGGPAGINYRVNRGGQMTLWSLKTGAQPATLLPEQSATVLKITAVHNGRDADVPLMMEHFRLQFLRAMQVPGQPGIWIPGAALSGSEVATLISQIIISRDGGTPGVPDAGDVDVAAVTPQSAAVQNGAVSVPAFVASAGNTINPGGWADFHVRIVLAPQAHTAATRHFYVVHAAVTDPQRTSAVHGGGLTPVRLTLQTVTGDEPSRIRVLVPGGIEVWRHQYFGIYDNDGSAANVADPDDDGLTNLVEYAYGLTPTAGEDTNNSVALRFTSPDAAGRPRLAFQLASPPRPDISVRLEWSPALVAPHTTMTQRLASGPWAGYAPVAAGLPANGRQPFTATDVTADGHDSGRRFYRLRVDELQSPGS